MQLTSLKTSAQSAASAGVSVSTKVQIVSAMLLGMVLLYGVGFASMDIAHNAAHDTRHTFAFPCH